MTTPQDPTSPQPYDRDAQFDRNAQVDPNAQGPSLNKPGDATPDPYGATPDPYGAAPAGGPVDPGQYPQPGDYQQSGQQAGYPQGDAAGQQGGYQQPGVYPQQGQPAQFGVQGQPGQFGQPGMTPIDPSAVKSKAKQRNIIIAVVAVVAIGLVAFIVIRSNSKDTANAKVGDCIQVTDATSNPPKTNQIGCGDPNAYYVVTEVGDSVTCEASESKYTQSGTASTQECLRPNLKQGECIKLQGAANHDFQKIDCSTAATTDAKVVLVDSTTSDKSKCPTGSDAVSFPKRNYLYCLAPAKS